MLDGAAQHPDLAELRELAERYGLSVETLVSRLALSLDEVARAVGTSKRTAEGWLARGEFPSAWKDGAVVRIPTLDLLRFQDRKRLTQRPRNPSNLREKARDALFR